MKGDIWYLKNQDGFYTHRFEVTNDDKCLMGKCYLQDLENSFVADVYCKWDSCTHWRFYGEDYDPGFTSNIDPYYHLCGSYCFTEHITAMCFVWKLAEKLISETMPSAKGEYIDNPQIAKLIETVLDGYEIVRV